MHFSQAIPICFQLLFSAVLICELSASPGVSRSLLTKFIEFLEREGCAPPVPPPFPQPSAAEPWSFLASPLRVCDNADSKARLIFCEEVFDVLSNVTCIPNRTIHSQPIEVVEEVCQAFHQSADLLATAKRPDFLGHKLSDLVLCELICSNLDMTDACRLLLWAYQLERSMWEQVPPDKLSADLENPHEDIKHGNDVSLEDKQHEGNQNTSADSNLEISNGNIGDISDKKKIPQSQDHINELEADHFSPQPILSETYSNLSHQKEIPFKEHNEDNQIPDEELKKVLEVDQKNGSKNGKISKSDVNKMIGEDNVLLKKKVTEQDEVLLKKKVTEQDEVLLKGKEDEHKLPKEPNTMVREDDTENALYNITDSSEHLKKGNLNAVKLPDISKTTVEEIKQSNVTEQGAKGIDLPDKSKTTTKENQSPDTETPLSDPSEDQLRPEKLSKNPEESINDSGNTPVLPLPSEMADDNKEEPKYGVAASTVAEKMDTDIVLEQQQNTDFEETVVKGETSNVDDGSGAVVAFEAEEDSHFLFYFLSIVLLVTAAYLLFHNKQKILALIVEGRGNERRRRNVTYRKLDTK